MARTTKVLSLVVRGHPYQSADHTIDNFFERQNLGVTWELNTRPEPIDGINQGQYLNKFLEFNIITYDACISLLQFVSAVKSNKDAFVMVAYVMA